MAAVLDWRLPEPAPTDPGPLPWLPGIPSTLHDHHVWGEYLAKRSQLVVGLANQVRDCASQKSEQPVWAPPGSHPSVALIAEIAVWRAAVGVDPQDRRPTGAGQLQAASALWQQNLDRDVALCSHRVGADVGKRQVGGPLSRSPARRSTSHASSTRCSSECPARAPRVSPVSAQEIWVINACARAPNKMARRKRSTCAQDRLQFSEALGLATTVTGLGRSLSTDCRSKGVPSDHCWIVFTVTSNSEVPAGEVSLRYELEPTGGPDAGPGLPGW
jgi:hypothetical protein